MAYPFNTESQSGYNLPQQQAQTQHQAIRKPSNTVHNAQAAYGSVHVNARAEHNFNQQNPYINQSSQSYSSQAPSAPRRPQRSHPMNESTPRKGSLDAASRLSGDEDGPSYEEKLEKAQQMMVQARIEEEIMRQIPQERKRTAYEAEIRRNTPPAIKNHIAYQTTSSHGLPSSPRTNTYQRTASVPEHKPSSTPEYRSNSVDQTKESNSFFSSAARKVSLALQGRSQSVDETASQSRKQAAPPTALRSQSITTGPQPVKIVCGTTILTITIMPTTTAMEVLSVCGSELGPGFDARRYVLVESFKEVGSERPVRYYERILDVVHSWDSEIDSQNELHIQSAQAIELSHWEYEALDLYAAPRIIPSDMTTTLYYSHRPESWHKWHFTLDSTGSITMQKYPGGESKTICSLTDFDIYVPSAKQLKKLGAPRKYCFAVKSQQKSVLFECSSQYVHFFCTNDKETAQEWFRAIHGWRSHYMVHKLGLRTEKGVATTPIRPSFSSASVSQRNASIASNAYRKPSETPSKSGSISSERYNDPSFANATRAGSFDSNYSYTSSSSASRNQSFDSSATEQSLINDEAMITPRPYMSSRKGSAEHAYHAQQQYQQQYQQQQQDQDRQWQAQTQIQQRETKTEFGPFVQAIPRSTSVSPSRSPSQSPPLAQQSQSPPWRNPSVASIQDSTQVSPSSSSSSSPSGFEWRFDPFTGEALSADSQTQSQSQKQRKGSQFSTRSGSVASAYGSGSGSRKGSSASMAGHALRKGSRDEHGGRKGSVAGRGNGKGRKASAVKLHTAEHLVAW